MTDSERLKLVFSKFALSIEDLRKILDADYAGPGPNFIAAEVAMAITEPIAKCYFPFKKVNETWAIVSKLDDINAKDAALKFFTDCFSNLRYSDLAYLVWDCFRNGHVHLFEPKMVTDIPAKEPFNSILAGVHWSGTKSTEISKDTSQEQIERSEHLKFSTTQINGKTVAYFRFCPLIYYFDLVQAVENFRKKVDEDPDLRKRFLISCQLLGEAKRMDFTNRLRRDEQTIILTELASL